METSGANASLVWRVMLKIDKKLCLLDRVLVRDSPELSDHQ